MAIDNVDAAIQLLFGAVLIRHKLEKVSSKGAIQALRAIMTAGELNRMAHILNSLPPADVGVQLLADYRTEVSDKLKKDHIFLAIDSELRPIRRPELLESYTYGGKIFVAISERKLVGAENGALKIYELSEFTYLPKKNRSTTVEDICSTWGVPSDKVCAFFDKYFYEVPLREQEDIFFDNQEIVVRYKGDRFVGAYPAPGPIPTISVLRKRLRTPSPTAAENTDEEDVCVDSSRPACLSVASSSQDVDPGIELEPEDI